MLHNLKALIALVIIEKIQAQGENNITSSRGHIKPQFGCVPQENWNVIKSSHNTNEVVCMSKNYNVDSRPSEIAVNPIFVKIEQSTIKDINEKKKTITMDINMILIWRDERIKATFPEDEGIIWLPPVTSEEMPRIWSPLAQLEIQNVTERKYTLDPIIWKMGVMASKTVNLLLELQSKGTYLSNVTTVVWSQVEWRVTVSCPFDFSNFPFDVHKCPLAMALPFDWNLTIHNENQHTTSYVADGFEIQSHEMGTEKFCIRLLATHWTVFYFDVHVKRQISQYIFQYYIPSITIVIASSVSFIIPLSAIPGRVALVVTQFLTLTNIFIHQMVIYLLRILANIGKLKQEYAHLFA